MISHTTQRFRQAYQALPDNIRKHARETYRIWQTDPYSKSLRFKKVHPSRPIYSIRIGLNWRALGVKEKDIMVWFWIGSYEIYSHLIRRF